MKEQLRDIKPLVEIPDASYLLYWLLVLISVAVLAAALLLLVRKLLRLCQKNLARIYLEELYRIDWNHPKDAAYKVTEYGRLLATDERRQELFAQLVRLLEQYKYRKNVHAVDEDTIRHFELYRKVCDESI